MQCTFVFGYVLGVMVFFCYLFSKSSAMWLDLFNASSQAYCLTLILFYLSMKLYSLDLTRYKNIKRQ